MTRWEFKMPDIGEGVAEGEIVNWLVQLGEQVQENQPLVEVMTDKATVTITSPKPGKVVEMRGNVGAVVRVHECLIAFEDIAGSGTSSAHENGNGASDSAPKSSGASAVGDLKDRLPGMPGWQGSEPGSSWIPRASERLQPIATAASNRNSHDASIQKPLATPAIRRLARDLHIDLRHVSATGPHGRITREDLQKAAEDTQSHATTPAHPVLSQDHEHPAPRAFAPLPETGDQRVSFVGLRRKIAEHMSLATHKAAHVTFVEELDAGALVAARKHLAPKADAKGVKLTFLAFIAKAVALALRDHPMLNSTLDEVSSEIVLRKQVHLGIASATPTGLVVPVIRNADQKSLLDLAREIDRLSAASKTGKLNASEITGSTFTITSLGPISGLLATPIINYPEVGIMGVHRIKQKPVVRDGQIVIGEVMTLSLSFDHRLIDGHIAAAFVYDVIERIETPSLMLL